MQACSGNLCAKCHTLSFINNLEKSDVVPIGFPSFVVNLCQHCKVILHMICYQAFSLLSGLSSMRAHLFKNVFELFHVKTSLRELNEKQR